MMSEHKNFTKLNWPEIVILIDVALMAFIGIFSDNYKRNFMSNRLSVWDIILIILCVAFMIIQPFYKPTNKQQESIKQKRLKNRHVHNCGCSNWFGCISIYF